MLTLAFESANLSVEWRGAGLDEVGVERGTNRVLVEIDERYFRPTEVDTLQGDATKAREVLGWTPQISLEEMVREMVEEDTRQAKRELDDEKAGNRAPRHLRIETMETNAAVYVAGHRGMVGSAILRQLEVKGFTQLVTATSNELDSP